MMENTHREAVEKATQAAPGVDPDVTSQPVPQRVGQVVDQRDVAKVVLAPPKDAVGLPGPEAVGGKDDDASTDLGHPMGLAHGLPVVVHVLEDLVEHFARPVMVWLPNHLATGSTEEQESGTNVFHYTNRSILDTAELRERLYYTMGDVDWW